MVNFDGSLYDNDTFYLNHTNRGLRYGDSLFESIRVVKEHIYFLEEHYLRLMASMRILRMEIPMNFTMEFLEAEILKTTRVNATVQAQRVRVTVFRKDGGLYLPSTNEISYCIEVKELKDVFYTINENPYEVELFKDFFVNKDMLSNLKTNNKVLNVVGSIFAKENGYELEPPAYFYDDDEITVVASERPVIQTAFNVPIEEIKEIEPGHALIIKKSGHVRQEMIKEPLERKACSFERIYFSRGTDKDIYLERKKLGAQLAPAVLRSVGYDFDNTVFSFVPNTAESAYFGLVEGLEKELNILRNKNWGKIVK